MRIVAAAAVLSLGLLSACDNGKMHLHPPDAPPGPRWWQPAPGDTRNWDIQLSGTVDVSAARDMYMLDLWALVPQAVTLDYGDGDPVTVPAGALASTIADLHGRSTRVVCHVATGAVADSDPDARKFPAASQGNTTGTPGQRFLDIRPASRAAWAPAMWKRLDLAKQIGCDAVATDKNDMIRFDPGFTIDPSEQVTWFVEVARQAHDRELSVGTRNGQYVAGQVDQIADDFDFMVVDRCGEYDECDLVRPFINLMNAVFAIDYTTDEEGMPQSDTSLCSRQQLAMVRDGLVKDAALTAAVRTQCVP